MGRQPRPSNRRGRLTRLKRRTPDGGDRPGVQFHRRFSEARWQDKVYLKLTERRPQLCQIPHVVRLAKLAKLAIRGRSYSISRVCR